MTKAATIDVGALIEGQRFGRLQAGLMFWICTFMFIEGYDMQVVGYAAPAIIKAWHSDKAAFGAVFGAGLGGFMLGATILGNLGDRFGRKRMIVAGSLLFGAIELFLDPENQFVMRVYTILGLFFGIYVTVATYRCAKNSKSLLLARFVRVASIITLVLLPVLTYFELKGALILTDLMQGQLPE